MMEMEKDVPNSCRKVQHDFRTQSFSYGNHSFPKDPGFKKESDGGRSVSSRFAAWNCMTDPEFRRKKRVANYKAYAMEGKMKGSFRKSFKWIKERCNQVINGY